jgi:predicted metal-dependent enzyme (double-stranded beta helix superfamily)
MSCTLEKLAADIRQALTEQPGRDGRERCRALVEKALADGGFVAAVFGPERTKVREVLYEDPDISFCICAHVYSGEAHSPPHDHGTSWAIYGQAEGVTEMTDWRIVRPAEGEEPALVEPVRTYELRPGMAHLYDVGAVHSPWRAGPTKLLRIEGANLDRVQRTPIKAADAQSA